MDKAKFLLLFQENIKYKHTLAHASFNVHLVFAVCLSIDTRQVAHFASPAILDARQRKKRPGKKLFSSSE
jgi:hypothetical protein